MQSKLDAYGIHLLFSSINATQDHNYCIQILKLTTKNLKKNELRNTYPLKLSIIITKYFHPILEMPNVADPHTFLLVCKADNMEHNKNTHQIPYYKVFVHTKLSTVIFYL